LRKHERPTDSPCSRVRKKGPPKLAVTPSAVLFRNANPFGIPSMSHWTGAAIIVQFPRTKTYIVTRWENLDQADASPLWPGDLRNDGGSVSAAGADGSEA